MVCLVTGSSRGLGRAIALSLGGRGHAVVVHYKTRKQDAEEVSALIKDSIIVQADVSIAEEVKVLVEKVIKEFGRIDVLINNAGIMKESLIVKTTEDVYDEIINTNLKGPFNLIKSAGRHMMKQKNGHIINISSYAGVKGKEGLAAYSASKAGLIGLTKTAARELAGYNISVNSVLPGYMLTDMGIHSSDKGKEKLLGESLLKEFSDPDNVAEFVSALIQTKGVSGQIFNIDSRIL